MILLILQRLIVTKINHDGETIFGIKKYASSFTNCSLKCLLITSIKLTTSVPKVKLFLSVCCLRFHGTIYCKPGMLCLKIFMKLTLYDFKKSFLRFYFFAFGNQSLRGNQYCNWCYFLNSQKHAVYNNIEDKLCMELITSK